MFSSGSQKKWGTQTSTIYLSLKDTNLNYISESKGTETSTIYLSLKDTNDQTYVSFVVITIVHHRVCSKSSTTRPHVELELLTLPEHMSSSPVFSVVRVAPSLFLCVMFCRSLFVLLSIFILAIVLSVLLLFAASDYPFCIFKPFFNSLKQITAYSV